MAKTVLLLLFNIGFPVSLFIFNCIIGSEITTMYSGWSQMGGFLSISGVMSMEWATLSCFL